PIRPATVRVRRGPASPRRSPRADTPTMIFRPRDGAPDPPRPAANERRRNVELRELLDEMIELARHLSHHARTMSAADLAYARERLEWLADEIWEQSTRATDGTSGPAPSGG
ncbi:MAG TPA: hypothetical protein VJU87_02205, partial [Gemmatimonadaceae bacterium]|nr:hypothetical protein [Gemmatimonadaceae bacterium]